MSGYDVFVCYVWEDKERADALVDALGRAGLRVFQDEKEVSDFHYLGGEIDEALRRSRTLLALYTPSFWASEYCRYELHFALRHAYALGRNRARVLAVVQAMEIADVRPGRLKNWRLPPRDQPLGELAAAVAQHVRELADDDDRRLGDASDPPAPAWFPARPSRHHLDFRGREQELWAIHDMLFADDDPASGGQVVGVIGPAGIGKTMLVEHYARLFALDSPGGVFVLTGFGSQGATGGRSAQVRQRRDELVRELTGTDDPERFLAQRPAYLWIVDDVPVDVDRATFERLLAPTANGRTLLTSRSNLAAWVPRERQVVLEDLRRDPALSVLISQWQPAGEPGDLGAEARLVRLRADRHAWASATKLVEDLAGHPLALTLAAGLIGRPDFGGFAALHDRVTAHDRNLVTLGDELDLHLPTDHAASILSTIGYSIETLPGSWDALRLASLGAQAPFPVPLFASTLAEADGIPPAEARQQVETQLALAERRFLALPAIASGNAAWEVHPLVSRVMRVIDPDPARRERLRAAAVVALGPVFDQGYTGATPATLAAYLPHVEELAAVMANVDDWHLLNEAGKVHAELGRATTLDLYRRLYDSCRARLGDEHRTTLVMLVGLGVAAGLQGDHRTALHLKEQVVETLTAMLGPDHVDTLVARNNLAVTHNDLGDNEQARDVYRSVHESRRRQLGENHPDTLEVLMNLSIAVGRSGDHDEALRLKRDVQRRMRAVHGDEHPRTLDAANHLAASLARTDRSAAHELFLQQADDRQRLSGPSADTALAFENAAATAPDWPTAARLMDGAYRIRLAAHGPAHPLSRAALGHLLVGLLRANDASSDPHGPRLVELVPLPVPSEADEDVDEDAVRILVWAGRWHDHVVARWGGDSPESLTALCLLAHALALLAQVDDQVEQAWGFIDDAATGLFQLNGADDPDAKLADLLRTWIADLTPRVKT